LLDEIKRPRIVTPGTRLTLHLFLPVILNFTYSPNSVELNHNQSFLKQEIIVISEKKTAKILIKYVFNPTLVFFIYFIIIASIGLSGKQGLIIYAITLPWLFILLLFFYIPFLMFLFRINEMELSTKINHVLEHGTIHFLKEHYRKKCRIGGNSLNEGFRIYGDIESKHDIKEAFERLKSYLSDGKSAVVLSKHCGSNTHILEGISFIMLTITLLIFLIYDLELIYVKITLVVNIIFYFLFRYPLGKYFQKRFVMYFDFYEPEILSIEKVKKKGLWERSTVYFVKTTYKI
jgi:hypothetical protein